MPNYGHFEHYLQKIYTTHLSALLTNSPNTTDQNFSRSHRYATSVTTGIQSALIHEAQLSSDHQHTKKKMKMKGDSSAFLTLARGMGGLDETAQTMVIYLFKL